MSVQDVVRLLLVFSVMLIVFGVGLRGRWSDVAYARRHPDLLWRGFAAVNVIVPATATLLCLLLPVPWLVKVGIVLMSVSPPAPFAPNKMLKVGADHAFVSGLFIILILSAIVIVPATIHLLNTISPERVDVPEGKLAAVIVITMLMPLMIGLAIASAWPHFAVRAAPIASRVAFAILIPITLLIVILKFSAVVALVGNGSVLTIAAVVCTALVGGHLLGGRRPEHRAAMAQVAATRHPGIAVIIAQRNFNDPQVIMTIALFLLISVVLSTAYAFWDRRAFAMAEASTAG